MKSSPIISKWLHRHGLLIGCIWLTIAVLYGAVWVFIPQHARDVGIAYVVLIVSALFAIDIIEHDRKHKEDHVQ